MLCLGTYQVVVALDLPLMQELRALLWSDRRKTRNWDMHSAIAEEYEGMLWSKIPFFVLAPADR